MCGEKAVIIVVKVSDPGRDRDQRRKITDLRPTHTLYDDRATLKKLGNELAHLNGPSCSVFCPMFKAPSFFSPRRTYPLQRRHIHTLCSGSLRVPHQKLPRLNHCHTPSLFWRLVLTVNVRRRYPILRGMPS